MRFLAHNGLCENSRVIGGYYVIVILIIPHPDVANSTTMYRARVGYTYLDVTVKEILMNDALENRLIATKSGSGEMSQYSRSRGTMNRQDPPPTPSESRACFLYPCSSMHNI